MIFMKKVLVMGIALMLSGATATMAQTKKPMKHKVDSTSLSRDSMMMGSDTSSSKMKKKSMKKTKPMKDSASMMK